MLTECIMLAMLSYLPDLSCMQCDRIVIGSLSEVARCKCNAHGMDTFQEIKSTQSYLCSSARFPKMTCRKRGPVAGMWT